jgi:Arc/MetJ-type ribon-helix-helix transcriptional regulator
VKRLIDMAISTRYDEATVSRIDILVEKGKFDNRSSFIRRAVREYLDQFETKVLA